jgi:hypothetical protein
MGRVKSKPLTRRVLIEKSEFILVKVKDGIFRVNNCIVKNSPIDITSFIFVAHEYEWNRNSYYPDESDNDIILIINIPKFWCDVIKKHV